MDAGGLLRGVQAGGRAHLYPREAPGERLECVRDRAHIGYAAQQSLQEDRAVRAGPGGVVADIDKGRDWDKEMAEVDRLLKKLPAADPTLGRPSGGERTVRKPAAVPGGGWSSGAGPTARGRGGTWAKVALRGLVGIGLAPGGSPFLHGCGL